MVRCAQSRAALATLLKRGRENWKALAWANGTPRCASEWAGENVARSWDHPATPYKVIVRCDLAWDKARPWAKRLSWQTQGGRVK